MNPKSAARLGVQLIGLFVLVLTLAETARMLAGLAALGFPPVSSMPQAWDLAAWFATNLALGMALGLLLLFDAAWLIRRIAPDNRPRCPVCSCLLKGLTESRCPECGCSIKSADDRSVSNPSIMPLGLGGSTLLRLFGLVVAILMLLDLARMAGQRADTLVNWLRGSDGVRVDLVGLLGLALLLAILMTGGALLIGVRWIGKRILLASSRSDPRYEPIVHTLTILLGVSLLLLAVADLAMHAHIPRDTARLGQAPFIWRFVFAGNNLAYILQAICGVLLVVAPSWLVRPVLRAVSTTGADAAKAECSDRSGEVHGDRRAALQSEGFSAVFQATVILMGVFFTVHFVANCIRIGSAFLGDNSFADTALRELRLLLFVLPSGCAGAHLILRSGWWTRRVLPADGPPCPHCSYDLRGLTSTRCPECGALVADDSVPPVRWIPSARQKVALQALLGLVGLYFVVVGADYFLFNAYHLLDLMHTTGSRYVRYMPMMFGTPLALIAAGLFLFFGVRGIANRLMPAESRYCPGCGWPLGESDQTTCPECDAPIPGDPPDCEP